MRTLITTLAKSICITSLILIASSLKASDVELRFSTAHYDQNKQELFVDIQIQNIQKGNLILAGQNYRFYYDSEILSLNSDDIKSKLSSDLYGDVKVEDHMKNISADHVSQLIFDDNLGFANFSIDLSDNVKGGLTLKEKDGWVTVATLKFKVLKTDARYDIVWGREGVSDKYATAFVEMAKWVSSRKLDKVSIAYYGDLTSEEKEASVAQIVDIQVGPNPASEFIVISFEEEIKETTIVVLRNAVGQQVKRELVNDGSISKRINLTDLIASNYFVEIYGSNENLIHNTQIILAK